MKNQFASLLKRVKAAFVDSIILFAMMYGATEILGLFEDVSNYVRGAFAIFVFLLYDPMLTSFYGGTIGHFFFGISVRKDENADKNISFPFAIFRFIFKVLLGWLSLLTITGNKKKKAIHDYFAKSIVIEKKP